MSSSCSNGVTSSRSSGICIVFGRRSTVCIVLGRRSTVCIVFGRRSGKVTTNKNNTQYRSLHAGTICAAVAENTTGI
jgi:hypothetical protein